MNCSFLGARLPNPGKKMLYDAVCASCRKGRFEYQDEKRETLNDLLLRTVEGVASRVG